METPTDDLFVFAAYDRPLSPNPFRQHKHQLSNYSASSSQSRSSLPSANPLLTLFNSSSETRPPKQRLHRLIKSSLKYSLSQKNADSANEEYWTTFDRKLRRIIASFRDRILLYDALNDPYSGSGTKLGRNRSCSSVIHILCKQFFLYARSAQWTICFTLWDCIAHLIESGANTVIFFERTHQAPYTNYNSLFPLYQGLQLMLNAEVIDEATFVGHFCLAVSAGNVDAAHIYDEVNEDQLTMTNSYSSVSTTPLTASTDPGPEQSPPEPQTQTHTQTQTPNHLSCAVLTLCVYKQAATVDDSDDDDDTCNNCNITYWLGDCCYSDFYVHLISPQLAKGFILMGYDLLHVVFHKLDHLDYGNQAILDTLVTDTLQLQRAFNTDDNDAIHGKVIAFLFFIRYGNFKPDILDILDTAVKQLALGEFVVGRKMLEHIMGYSHHFVAAHSSELKGDCGMCKLNLPFFDEDRWMMRAFEMVFKLENSWIDWIGEYVMPQLTPAQTERIRRNLSAAVSEKEWNKFIRRISLRAINAFCTHNLFGEIETRHMQNIIKQQYRDPELVPVILNAKYDTEQVWGNSSMLFSIVNDARMRDAQHIDAIIGAIHARIETSKHDGANNYEKYIIHDLLFSKPWEPNDAIWKKIRVVFNEKYTYFVSALNDFFEDLTTEQHYAKFVFFMQHEMIDFDYCLKKDLIESGLQNLLYAEEPFDSKAACIQLIGDWIYAKYVKERDPQHRKHIASKSIAAITANISDTDSTSPESHERDEVIIGQYLQQLKQALAK